MKLNIINDINKYLDKSEIIDFDNLKVLELAHQLKERALDKLELIRNTYEYVRDEISHSADINGVVATCKASDVLFHKEGICYAKSHLLAALLRANHIPCGFCYQRLILNDETASYLVLHGLNAVYIEEIDKWIRVDARGNKPGVDAQFNLEVEQLAFKVRNDLGEEDIYVVYSEPDSNVTESLLRHTNVKELFDNLPKELSNL